LQAFLIFEPMVKILIVAATEGEVSKITEHLEFSSHGTKELKHYKYYNAEVDVLITGVGMVATAYHLGRLLANSFYTVIYNIGVCGCFDRTIELGTVVHVTSDSFPEIGAQDGEKFLSVFDMGLMNKDDSPFKDKELFSYHPPQLKTMNNLKQVKGITVNTVSESLPQSIIHNPQSPIIESMEGAAFLYASLSEQIPCAQIRGISNYVEKRNKANWQMEKAIENLTHTMLNILSEISENA